ncbi:preprotein translocase subunit SecE [Mycoplasmopsis iners]|uniref:preprotein translocase subunit SecE n=1 Tax=Mycoplasmopsis iners TaxID=76630 RepID=UPI000497B27C|nr:preprotein translocase subunit SecE [Mycoplasmopsis iners]
MKKNKNKEKKIKKPKKFLIRRFVKEIKRVRWPSSKKNWSSFFQVVIFSSIFVSVVLIIATVFSLMWKGMNIK